MRNSTRLDHRATWNEVYDALAFSSLEFTEFGRAVAVRSEAGPELREGIGPLAEELAWLELANEALDSICN